jgi:CRISPR-associated exonuclease Cas4
MDPAEQPSAKSGVEPERIPISALNQYLYCARRAYLIHAEGVFVANEHTVLGDLAHAAVDTPGYEHRAGWELLRALPLYSDALGLSGKADIVEVRRDQSDRVCEARPVETKKGPARRWGNDQVQLCAQALCLEEMLGLPKIGSGFIYHVASAKRTEVTFDTPLRNLTISTIQAVRAVLGQPVAPPAELKPQCEGCSLRGVCLPEAAEKSVTRNRLFEPREYV